MGSLNIELLMDNSAPRLFIISEASGSRSNWRYELYGFKRQF